MAHVHITLVGGQPMPVYNGIVTTNPDKIIFIYSKQSQGQINSIKSVINNNIEIVKSEPLSSTNPQEILERAQQLAQTYKDDKISLNISSGLKSWSHLFGRVFDSKPNVDVIYIDQNNVVWNYRTMKQEQVVDFDLDVLFRLQGNPLIHFIPYSNYTKDDKKTMDQLIVARKYNCGTFNKLTTLLSKEWENKINNQKIGKFELSEKEYIEWEKPDFVRLVLCTKKHGSKEFVLESPNAVNMAFHTGWFEYKIARMISHWRYAKDIRLNCIFPQHMKPDIRFPKNEIDIIVNMGTKLLFVECKTQIANSTDIDKFRTAVKNYGGMGSKALFITDNIMTDIQKEKCRESGIMTFSLQDNAIGLNKEQELFKLLETELSNINTK